MFKKKRNLQRFDKIAAKRVRGPGDSFIRVRVRQEMGVAGQRNQRPHLQRAQLCSHVNGLEIYDSNRIEMTITCTRSGRPAAAATEAFCMLIFSISSVKLKQKIHSVHGSVCTCKAVLLTSSCLQAVF